MRNFLPDNLLKLADVCQHSLYIVGGSVRDFLAGKLAARPDWDICSPAPEDELVSAAERCGIAVRAVYPRTGTVKLSDGKNEFEFTRFRTDRYERGLHAPAEISFTEDIGADARRRDFCANAVYYDIAKGKFCDPLGGMDDIGRKILRTVAPARTVFGEDGLRLMRLARIAAQTGFAPDAECLAGARENAALIDDIVPERIFTELRLLLFSDEKTGDFRSPYRGLCLLRETGVLAHILPELAAGDGMPQRRDFHDHDVLEHSLRCAMYAPPEVRFAALLHDVGKPFCMLRDGNFYAHPEEGARIARDILTRLKAPIKLTEETAELVRLHMRDVDLRMRESKIRRELVEHYPLTDKLFALKQADYSACKDDLSPAPGVEKWKNILSRMRDEGVPMTVGELAVNGLDLQRAGVPAPRTAEALSALLSFCTEDGTRNKKETLLARAKSQFAGE